MGISITAATISETASTINGLNKQLSTSLEESQAAVHSLRGVWEGAAAEATIGAYDQFASRYFDEYYKLIDDYVHFLQFAAENWSDTEDDVQDIGESIMSGAQAAAEAIK